MKLTRREQALIDYVKAELKQFNAKLIIHDGYMTKWRGKDYSSGHFDYPEINSKLKYPRLHVAVGGGRPKKEWLGVILHEFCHFRQWILQTKCWTTFNETNTIESSANIERECEKMTIALIKKQKFDDIIDIKQYTKMANAYILFYQVYAITDKWYEIAPFSFKEIRELMPDKLVTKAFSRRINDELMSLYLRKCYKRKK